MNTTSYERLTITNDYYKTVNVNDLVFDEEYISIKGDVNFRDVQVTDSVKDLFTKFVGLSSSINKGLYSVDKDLWYKVLTKLYNYYKKEEILLLMSESNGNTCIKGIITGREPVDTKTFIDRVISYYKDYDNLEVVDISYTKGLTTSGVVLVDKSKSYTDVDNKQFNLGVSFRSDELYNTYCRMVVYYSDNVIYNLPSKYYNLSSSRYDKTTNNSSEALDILLLRVLEDFNSDVISDKSEDIRNLILLSKDKYVTRAEYERLFILMSNVSATSDMSEEETNDILDSIRTMDDFERLYGSISSEYLWKCTAIGGSTFSTLLNVVNSILNEHVFYPEDSNSIRDLLGEYLALPRICQVLAKKNAR